MEYEEQVQEIADELRTYADHTDDDTLRSMGERLEQIAISIGLSAFADFEYRQITGT